MAWPAIIGTAISAGASLLGQRAAGRQQRRNVRDQTEANKELAQFTHDRNVELWREQMEYNHPMAQMQRFGEAGLNPHLIYGQGTPGLADTPPKMTTPQAGDYSQRGPMMNPMTVLAEHLDIAGKKQQLRHVEKQIEVEEMSALLKEAQTANMWNVTTINSLESEIAKYIMDYDAGEIRNIAKGRIAGMKAEDWLKKATYDLNRWQADFAIKHNIHPRDSIYWRMAMDILESVGFTPRQIMKSMEETRKGIKDYTGY